MIVSITLSKDDLAKQLFNDKRLASSYVPELQNARLASFSSDFVVGIQHHQAGHEHSQLLVEMTLFSESILLGITWFTTESGTSIIIPIL